MVVSGAHVVRIQVRQPVLDGVVRPRQALGSLTPEQVYNEDAA